MEVNNPTLSVQKEQTEAAENPETAQKIGPAERNDLVEKLKRLEQMYKNRTKLKNGKIISEWKWKKLSNFLKRKSVGTDSSPMPAKVIQPPEKWTTCRLRQNGRELVRNRIQLSVKLKKTRERNRIAKERLFQQNGQADLSLVKLEEEKDLGVTQQEDVQQEIGSSFDVGVQYFEIYECCAKESTQRTAVTIPGSENQFDIISNLLSSMYRKKQSDQPNTCNPMQLVDSLSATTSHDYILSTIRWHKLKNRRMGGSL